MHLERQGQVRATCPGCRGDGLQEMGFTLKDGNTAQMRRCGRCEWKSWWLDGRQVSLAELLTTVQSTGLPRASRRRPQH